MNALTQPALARTEAIDEALYDAICDGEGRPRPDALAHHLALHGLVIVEASKWSSAKTALMVIGSCGAPLGGNSIGTALDTAAEVARAALKKMGA